MADAVAHHPLLAALRARNEATAGYAVLIADYQAAATGRRELQVKRENADRGKKKRGGAPTLSSRARRPL